MKDFLRQEPLFSLCGLNCGLCTMHLGGLPRLRWRGRQPVLFPGPVLPPARRGGFLLDVPGLSL